MRHLSYRTRPAKEADIQRKWYIVDATNQTLGRMCSGIASILRGKNRPYYTPHLDCGDYIIVINSAKVVLTGNKMEDKDYITYSGYPGGQKHEAAKELIVRRPNQIIERAVKGMLPKNRLGRAMVKKIFIYEGAAHPHTAQKPEELKF